MLKTLGWKDQERTGAGGPRLSRLLSREILHFDSVCADPQGWLTIEAKIALELEGRTAW